MAPSITTPALTFSRARPAACAPAPRSSSCADDRRYVPFVLEPESERRARLMAYPKPGELNHRWPQSRVARLRDALLAIDRPALPRRWGEAGISGDLSAVVEVSGESFTPEDRSELRPNAMDIQQHRRRGRHFGLFCAGGARLQWWLIPSSVAAAARREPRGGSRRG